MDDIYLVVDKQKQGPFTRRQVYEKLEEGKVDRKTLGWMQGEDSWKPLEEIESVLVLIEELEQEQLDEELAKDPGPPPAAQSQVPYEKLTSHAFARFGARMLDVFLLHTIVLMLVPLPEAPADDRTFWEGLREGMTEEQQAYTYRILFIQMGSILGWHLLESVFLATIGTTFGKYLFNLRVQTSRGTKLGFPTSLSRGILVWLLGMGGGMAALQWIANFLAFRRLQLNGITTWDRMLKTEVIQGPISQFRMTLIFVSSALIFGARYMLLT